VWKPRKFCKFCVVGAIEISNRELNVTRVDAGSITAVVLLKLKWQRAGNGSVISVDRSESGCYRRNCRMFCFKLTIEQGRTRP